VVGGSGHHERQCDGQVWAQVRFFFSRHVLLIFVCVFPCPCLSLSPLSLPLSLFLSLFPIPLFSLALSLSLARARSLSLLQESIGANSEGLGKGFRIYGLVRLAVIYIYLGINRCSERGRVAQVVGE